MARSSDDDELNDAGLPHPVVLRAATPLAALAAGALSPAWTAGIKTPTRRL